MTGTRGLGGGVGATGRRATALAPPRKPPLEGAPAPAPLATTALVSAAPRTTAGDGLEGPAGFAARIGFAGLAPRVIFATDFFFTAFMICDTSCASPAVFCG